LTNPEPELSSIKSLGLTALAMCAFAANSVLCRLGLGKSAIDPAAYTTLRIVSGAIVLSMLLRTRANHPIAQSPDHSTTAWLSPAMLFLYAIAFSFAYVSLSVGTGALILFGAVQATMILSGLRSGERPPLLEYVGLVVALLGLIYLVFPGLAAPSPVGSALMAVAGIAWGIYSIRGRGVSDPLAETAGNFAHAAPMSVAASLIAFPSLQLTTKGAILAIVSGAVASGLGYVAWYAALRNLTAIRAATVQLCVPVLAAVAGVVFLAEGLSIRLMISSLMILGGISIVVLKPKR